MLLSAGMFGRLNQWFLIAWTGVLTGCGSTPAAPPDDTGGVARLHRPRGAKTEICSGALVEPDKVLFAAHCVIIDTFIEAEDRALEALLEEVIAGNEAAFDAAAPRMRAIYEATPSQGVYAGQAYFGEQLRNVISVKIDAGFWQSYIGAGITCVDGLPPGASTEKMAAFKRCMGKRELSHDFALARLDHPVSDVPPMRLATADQMSRYVHVGSRTRSLGYGAPHGESESLRTTALIVDSMTDVALIASSEDGVGTCHGDSGGPLILDTVEGLLIIGVLSATPGDDIAGPCSRTSQFGRTDAMDL